MDLSLCCLENPFGLQEEILISHRLGEEGLKRPKHYYYLHIWNIQSEDLLSL